MSQDDSVESLRARIQQIEAELAQKNKIIQDLNGKIKEASEGSQPATELTEIEETLRRMLTRTGMIVQGNKCLLMIHDAETHELYAQKPTLNIDEAILATRRIGESAGVSGQVFTSGRSIITYDAESEPRAAEENLSEMGVRNGVCVPLVVEKRDEETNKVIDRRTIGVLHVFNQRFGGVFTDEDVQLLERMSRNAAAVVNNASQYIKVVKEKKELEEQINALSIGLVMINHSGRVTQMNASARQVLGIPLEDPLHGKPYDAVIRNGEVVTLLRKAIDGEADVSEEVVLAEPGAPENIHTFQVQTAGVHSDSGENLGMVAIFNDITEIKNVDKLKTAFVSTVSHELRTPMTSIKGFVATLLMDEDGSMFPHTDRMEFYGIIDKECDRLRRLIDDLLNVSRIEANAAMMMNFEPVDVRDSLKKTIIIENGSTYKKDSHSLTYEVADDVPQSIEADPDKFEQILHNVIGNSLKYSPDGGDVKVKVTLMPGGELLQFAVSDQGLGMSPEFLTKFGEKFVRQDNRDTRSINGTGIGIFLVKNFVEGHGGRMWPHSEGLGKGSTIFFTLPIKQDEDASTTNLAGKVAA